MTTSRDLVEAASWTRRRLVTALVAGAPGGREARPERPGRQVAASAVLAAVVGAGAVLLERLVR
jgi:hypothetical protein